MAAKLYFHIGREPADAIALALWDDKGRFGKIVFSRNRLARA